jgi:hypothetical protein
MASINKDIFRRNCPHCGIQIPNEEPGKTTIVTVCSSTLCGKEYKIPGKYHTVQSTNIGFYNLDMEYNDICTSTVTISEDWYMILTNQNAMIQGIFDEGHEITVLRNDISEVRKLQEYCLNTITNHKGFAWWEDITDDLLECHKICDQLKREISYLNEFIEKRNQEKSWLDSVANLVMHNVTEPKRPKPKTPRTSVSRTHRATEEKCITVAELGTEIAKALTVFNHRIPGIEGKLDENISLFADLYKNKPLNYFISVLKKKETPCDLSEARESLRSLIPQWNPTLKMTKDNKQKSGLHIPGRKFRKQKLSDNILRDVLAVEQRYYLDEHLSKKRKQEQIS